METRTPSTPNATVKRRLPVGAEDVGNGVSFRVWAPSHGRVSVVFESSQEEFALEPEPGGYFSGTSPSAAAGMRYRFRLGADPTLYPDPASRFQPEGPHGPSEIVSPATFRWSDSAWPGVTIHGQVMYELHIGTFTTEGTWVSAAERLRQLADLGITTIELMPVAEFPGRFGWGYDGVDLYAPCHLYGQPDDFRRFVDYAHSLRLAVILDVVYNHFGPDGNYLRAFSPAYFSTRYDNEWGDAINFDGPDAAPVREFIVANARYWIDEFHLDGLRLDATQQIFDDSSEHLVKALTREARDAAGRRRIIVVAENEPQDARLARPLERGGFGLDALWNDDFHHAAVAVLTGRREAYFTDYTGSPQEFISMIKWGFLYQGQRYSWQKKRRGTAALDIPPAGFITFLQNHDQIANGMTGEGRRLHQLSSPAAYRAMTALWLLAPGTPMFFQGQEFCASTPFCYFADHGGELGAAVRNGRAEFMRQFRSLSALPIPDVLADPSAEQTFLACRLIDQERAGHHEAVALHRDLLSLRRRDPAFRAQLPGAVDGAVLGPQAFVLRFFGDHQGRHHPASERDRLVVVNLGVDLHLDPAPEPLLAPPVGAHWETLWTSEDRLYGGTGTAPLDSDENWRIPGQATVVLAPRRHG